jgi:hypothetical protein
MKRAEWLLVIGVHKRWRDPFFWARIDALIAKDAIQSHRAKPKGKT